MWWLLACAQDEPVDTSSTEEVCAEGEVREGARCLPEDCGVGVWGNLDTSQDATYVDPLAPAGGDGSLERPFRSLDETNHAPLVYLAEGRYPRHLFTGIAVPEVFVGRCQELVTLEADIAGDAALIHAIDESSVTLREITFEGVVTAAGGRTIVEDSVITGAPLQGAYAGNLGTLELRRVRIENTFPDGNRIGGWGIFAEYGGHVFAQDVDLVDNASVGVMVFPYASFVGQDVRVDGTGEGLEVEGGLVAQGEAAVLVCTECSVDGASGAGILALKEGTVTVSDTTVQNIVPVDGTALGALADDARLELADVSITGIDGYGVVVRNGAVGSLERIVLDGIGLDDPSFLGAAVGVFEKADLTASDVEIRDVVGAGLLLDDATARVDGLVIQDVAGPGNGQGPAVAALFGQLYANDVHIERATGQAVVVQDAGRVELSNARIAQTQPVDETSVDVAVNDYSAFVGADVEFSGGENGIALGQEAYLELSEFVLGPAPGLGILAQDGAQAYLTDGSITGRHAVGAAALGTSELTDQPSRMVLSDVRVEGTRRRQDLKLATGLAFVQEGVGRLLGVQVHDTQGNGVVAEGGTLIVQGATVTDSQLAGVFVAKGGDASLRDLDISGVEVEPTTGLAMGLFVGGTDATCSASALTITDAGHAGIWVENGELVLSDSAVAGGSPVELLPGVWAYGHAVFSAYSTLALLNSTLYDAGGPGLFLHEPDIQFDTVSFTGNVLDLHAQGCTEFTPPDGITATVCPEFDQPIVSMDFFNVVDLGGL